MDTHPAEHFRRNLSLLWLAQFISKVGDQLFAVSGIFLVMMLAGGESSSSSLFGGAFEMAHALPALLLGPFLGVLVDRHRRKRVMFFADLARALLLLVIPLLAWQGKLEWWSVLVVAFGVFSFTTAFAPARDAFVPILAAGRGDLTRINGLFQTSIPIAVLIGSGLLALVDISEADPVATLAVLILVDASTFLVSALLLLFISVNEEKVVRPEVHVTIWNDVRGTISLSAKDRRLRALLISTALSNFFIMGPAILGAALLVRTSLNYPEEQAPRMYGLFEGSMLVGMLLGMAWLMRYAKKFARGKVLVWGLILDGLTYVPFVFLRGNDVPFFIYCLLVGFHGFFIPWIWTVRTAIIQEYYPRGHHGRIFAFVGLTVTGFHALSAGVTGWLGTSIDAHWLFFWGGLGGLVSGVIAWRFRELWQTK